MSVAGSKEAAVSDSALTAASVFCTRRFEGLLSQPVQTQHGRQWAIGGAVLVLCAAAIRFHNAFHYPLHFGFDAPANWDYIAHLLTSWRLPSPGEGWSMSHPPFFYYASALLGRAMGGADKEAITIAVRLVSSVVGLLGIGAVVYWLRVSDRENLPRVTIAAALLLFLPAHIYMSAMLGEEILSGALISAVVVGVALDLRREPAERFGLPTIGLFGLLAGLAFLTKLTGLLVVGAVGLAYLADGLRRRTLGAFFVRALVFCGVAVAVGGWPYLLNQIQYGFFYPQNLMVHDVMFTMPPGERFVLDYLTLPLATFRDPQVLAPDLLHSVWGTTYTTLWFDGHRVMLPRSEASVQAVGTALLILGLLPTLAFFVGIVRGAKRALREPGGPDTLFLALTGLTVLGYMIFSWQNPWYATLKASYLLGAAVPFAVYSSEVLAGWVQGGSTLRRAFIATPLLVLLIGSAATFTVNLVFEKREGPGFEWPKVDPSRHYERAVPADASRQRQGGAKR